MKSTSAADTSIQAVEPVSISPFIHGATGDDSRFQFSVKYEF